jgi:hypothetical protein
MKKEIKLINKVKRLLRRLGFPRWLHHFGPKKYEFREHLQALLMRAFCQLSFRRVQQFFELIGIKCPKKSALQQTAAKLSSTFWNRILKMTCGNSYLVAIDSTGFSRTQASYHYLHRIDGKLPQVPVKLSVAIDTRKKKFCCARIRILPAHDSRDAKFLLKKSKPKKAVLDKAYNSEELYEFAFYKKILLMIPKKINVKRGFFRKKAEKLFKIKTYHR